MAGHQQQSDHRPWDTPSTTTSPNLQTQDNYFPRPSFKHRSTTMTSFASSYKSPSLSLTSSTPTLNGTNREGITPLASPFERPESVARNILSRGSRILKRQGSKFNLSPSFSSDAEEGWSRPAKTSEVSEVFHRVPKIRSKSAHGKRELYYVFQPCGTLTRYRRRVEELYLGTLRFPSRDSHPSCAFQGS